MFEMYRFLRSVSQLTNIDNVNWPQNIQTLYLFNNQFASIDKITWPQTLQTLELSGIKLDNTDAKKILQSCKERYNKNVIENIKVLPMYKVLQDLIGEFLIR